MAGEPKFYVYAVMDGVTCLYVGKGSGYRKNQSAKKHGGSPVILERFSCEKKAYVKEKEYIAELQPTENKDAGGFGGISAPVGPHVPKILKGVYTCRQWKNHEAKVWREMRDIERVGSQVNSARFLMTRINESNREKYGITADTLAQSYRNHYDTENMADKTVWEASSRLMADSKVTARLAELQAESAERSQVTVESLTIEMDENRKRADELDQVATMQSASMGKAKLHGHLVDKADTKIELGVSDAMALLLSTVTANTKRIGE